MEIFILLPDYENYEGLRFTNPEDWQIMYKFKGIALANSWNPVDVYTDEHGYTGDFPGLPGGIPPVFSERALKILSPIILDDIEALPLNNSTAQLYAINVLTVSDCLDQSRSQMQLFNDNRVMVIERYAFKENCLQDKHIFKIPEQLGNLVYVSGAFKTLIEENGLTGLEFKKIYP